jgi:aspartate aminotransferase
MKYSKVLEKMTGSASMKSGLNSAKDYTNLAIGSPDILPPKDLIDIIHGKISQLDFNYMPSKGSELARANLVRLINGVEDNPEIDRISLIPGAKYGIYNSLKTITNPGDKVLIIEPYWLSYPEIIKSLHLELATYEIDLTSLKLDIIHLINKIKQIRPRVIIINNPNNPLGSIIENSLLEEIIDFCVEAKVWVLLDEVYKDLTFTPQNLHVSLHQSNLIRVGSFSKSLSIPGLRLGYVLASPKFIDKFNILDQHITTSVNSLSHLVAENLNNINYSKHLLNICSEYCNRYVCFSERIRSIDCEIIKIESGFYCLVKSPDFNSGAKFKEYLYTKKILVTEGIAYGSSLNKYIRVCLTAPINQLEDSALKFR